MIKKIIAQASIGLGAYVEYRRFKETDVVVIKPEHISFEEAATLSFGSTTAWAFLTEKTQLITKQNLSRIDLKNMKLFSI
jgi:NADPH:quinone reductase-like Zn-dependent oxidoreductase